MPQSPLHAMHQAFGAVFTDVAGWPVPAHFGNANAEYQTVRQSVGAIDLSPRSLIHINGSHRQLAAAARSKAWQGFVRSGQADPNGLGLRPSGFPAQGFRNDPSGEAGWGSM